MNARCFCTLSQVPTGFEKGLPHRRDLLGGPILLLLGHLDELHALAGDSLERICGVVVTPGPAASQQLSPTLWHLSLPEVNAESFPVVVEPLLQLLVQQRTLEDQRQRDAILLERLQRDATVTREDHARASERLMAQVSQLTEARAAEVLIGNRLRELNDELEGRVAKRTRELAHAKEMAESANRAKSAFLANMSHEIRTPMNGVMGLLDVLAKSHLNEDQARLVGTAQESASLLLSIVDDILDFSKIEAGGMTLAPAATNVRQLMDRVSSVLEVAAGQKKLIFACVVDTKLHDWLWMDSLRMSQVLLNLGGNAIKFTGGNNRQGRIAMRLLVEDEQADNLRLRFVVEDNGIGMSEESCRHVFDPFSQAENSTSRRFGGTGLGLAISQRLVTLMGGEIGVMSRPDEGSTFWVRVTAKKATPRKDADVPLFGFEQTRLSILVVDDNETNLLVASRIMENLGHKAATANNGEEALAMLEKQRFDLVLMDCHMPVMDGFEATRRLREREERLGLSHHYVFAMTAGVLPEEQKRCFAAGMDDFMPKPLRLGKVAAQLAHWQPAVVGRSKVAAGHHDGLTK